MTQQPVVFAEQDEDRYYVYVPVLESSQQIESASWDEVLPDIWEAVAVYLETISGEVTLSA